MGRLKAEHVQWNDFFSFSILTCTSSELVCTLVKSLIAKHELEKSLINVCEMPSLSIFMKIDFTSLGKAKLCSTDGLRFNGKSFNFEGC